MVHLFQKCLKLKMSRNAVDWPHFWIPECEVTERQQDRIQEWLHFKALALWLHFHLASTLVLIFVSFMSDTSSGKQAHSNHLSNYDPVIEMHNIFPILSKEHLVKYFRLQTLERAQVLFIVMCFLTLTCSSTPYKCVIVHQFAFFKFSISQFFGNIFLVHFHLNGNF